MSNTNINEDLDLNSVPDNIRDEESGAEQLVFPINVHESLAASGGLKKSEKNGIIISFWVFLNGLLVWFLAGWLRQVLPGHYIWVTLAIELVIQLTLGVFLLRIIMDESTAVSELSSDGNSFSKYFGIYHEIIADDSSAYPFDVIEMVDGSYAVYIQCLLGYNTSKASTTTYEVNKHIVSILNKSSMPYKVLYMNEKFSNSTAAEKLRKVVAGVEDPRLFGVYRDIVQRLLFIANEESNVLSTTFIVYAKTRIQKEELGGLVNNILSSVFGEDTAYREVSTLSYEDIVELYRTYYKLDVLDMGLIRAHTVKRKSISCSLRLLRVYGASGKIYNTQDMRKLKETMLREHGLEQVNAKAKGGN